MRRTARKILTRYKQFKKKNIIEPLFAYVSVRFKDEENGFDTIIKLFDEVGSEREDKLVFFYCTSLDELVHLSEPDNGEDFIVTGIDVFGSSIV